MQDSNTKPEKTSDLGTTPKQDDKLDSQESKPKSAFVLPNSPDTLATHENETSSTDTQGAQVAEIGSEVEDISSEDTTDDEPRSNPFVSVGKTIFSWIILPALIVLFLHTFIFQAFYVSGSSMNPDFEDGDYLIVDKIGITLSAIRGAVGLGGALSIKRGDVLVFKYPNSPSTFFIKRLIGEPGDRVVIKDAQVTVYPAGSNDSITLKEPYTDPQYKTEGDIDEVVDKDKYFVMGDNRSPNGSFDSRAWGQLPKDDVVGVATTRLLPINNLGPIKHPTY